MPKIATIVICKNCGYEIRDDWHFCPRCGDRIICEKRIEEAREKTRKTNESQSKDQ